MLNDHPTIAMPERNLASKRPCFLLPLTLLIEAFLLGGVLLGTPSPTRAQERQDVQYNQPSFKHPPPAARLADGSGGTRAKLLFWRKGPQRGDPDWQAQKRREMQALQAEGQRPMTGIFRWKQAFYRSQPGTGRQWSDHPSHTAWYEYLDARRNLMMRNADGSMTSVSAEDGEAQAVYGFINPNMPMPKADRPAGADSFTNADWEARRIGAFAKATGVRGVKLADGGDSMPFGDTRERDFNPRLIDDFERAAGVEIPGSTIPERARHIKQNHFVKWQNYWSEAYATYQGKMVGAIEKQTGQQAFLWTQAPHTTPADMRYRAYDSRMIMEQLDPDQFMQTVQVWLFGDRAWKNGRVPLLGAYHARQPNLARGAMMPTICGGSVQYTSDPGCNQGRFFWNRSVGKRPEDGFSEAELTELGKKRLRELWLYLGWTHLANEDGAVERAIEYVTGGGHGTATKKDLPAPLWEAFQNIRPVRPYGLAAYYSVPIERSFEANRKEYPFSSEIRDFAAEHALPLYYVSDQTLPKLKPDAHPTGWVVPHAERLPEEERQALTSVAPIYDPAEEERAPAASPIAFEGAATGTAFVDQKGRGILVATRTGYDKRTAEVTIRFQGLSEDGSYTATNHFDESETHEITIEDGEGRFTIPLERWETRVFVIPNLPPPTTQSETTSDP